MRLFNAVMELEEEIYKNIKLNNVNSTIISVAEIKNPEIKKMLVNKGYYLINNMMHKQFCRFLEDVSKATNLSLKLVIERTSRTDYRMEVLIMPDLITSQNE